MFLSRCWNPGFSRSLRVPGLIRSAGRAPGAAGPVVLQRLVAAVVDDRRLADPGILPGFHVTVGQQLTTAAARGKRFLFRSGASLLTSLAALPPQPVPAEPSSSNETAVARRVGLKRVCMVRLLRSNRCVWFG